MDAKDHPDKVDDMLTSDTCDSEPWTTDRGHMADEVDSNEAIETGEQASRLNKNIFRYTDLPDELREYILEQMMLVTYKNGERLSRLAAVCFWWKERVEVITFHRLGAFPEPCCDTCLASSPFQAVDLKEFERIVVGKRRTLLHRIAIDFDLDKEGTPEMLLGTKCFGTIDEAGDETVVCIRNAVARRRSNRFANYTREFFRILHSWDPIGSGPAHLDVKIRVCGRVIDQLLGHSMDMREDFSTLPYVSAIRNFELVYNAGGQDGGLWSPILYYVPPGSVLEILRRLPFLQSTTTDLRLSDTVSRSLALIFVFDSGLRRNQLSKDAFVDFPDAMPSTVRKLVVKNTSTDFWGCVPFDLLASGPCKDDKDCFNTICALGCQLEELTLDRVVLAVDFLAYALKSLSSKPWVHMRQFVLDNYGLQFCANEQQIDRALALAFDFVGQTPMLQKFVLKLQFSTEESGPAQHQHEQVSIKIRYIKTTNRDDHMLLSTKGRIDISADSFKKFERIIKQSRGMPLRLSQKFREPVSAEEQQEVPQDEA